MSIVKNWGPAWPGLLSRVTHRRTYYDRRAGDAKCITASTPVRSATICGSHRGYELAASSVVHPAEAAHSTGHASASDAAALPRCGLRDGAAEPWLFWDRRVATEREAWLRRRVGTEREASIPGLHIANQDAVTGGASTAAR